MNQSEKEKQFLDNLFEKKSKINYDLKYFSSSVDKTNAELGTVESDVSGKFGRWNSEPFRSSKLAEIVNLYSGINSVLDIGAGNLLASSFFVNSGKLVDICDFEDSVYISEKALNSVDINKKYIGDFCHLEFDGKYDMIWCSHVLEHQLNVQDFLEKLVSLVNPDGYIALSVPPRKPFIVSGHINLFNPGLLLYRLILSGLDCSESKCFQYDGNICFFSKINKINLPKLNYDAGDIEKIKKYFPFEVSEGFNGDFMNCNLTSEEYRIIYGK